MHQNSVFIPFLNSTKVTIYGTQTVCLLIPMFNVLMKSLQRPKHNLFFENESRYDTSPDKKN